MKCPHCEYEHGWSSEELKNIDGSHGEFFYLPVKFSREKESYYGLIYEKRTLVGCPSCSKTFID